MKSHLYHIQINIDFKNLSFYKNLMEELGWQVIFETEDVCGYKNETTGDVWFCQAQKKEVGDYDTTGVNHISFRVENLSDVGVVVDHLKTSGVATLFDTPKHRGEFVAKEDETYYQVMFKSPDNILFEVVYIGPK